MDAATTEWHGNMPPKRRAQREGQPCQAGVEATHPRNDVDTVARLRFC